MSARLIGILAFLLVAACFRAPPQPDHIALHSGLIEMRKQFESCRAYCFYVAPVRTCNKRLIPPHDALVLIHTDINPKDEPAEAAIGCAGLSVKLGLEALRADFQAMNIEEPSSLQDALILGNWAAQWARDSCDPYSPTTRVVMHESLSIPRVNPDYPDYSKIPGTVFPR